MFLRLIPVTQMLKRLDWLDVHGQHGGDTSSDDSDSSSGTGPLLGLPTTML